MRFMLPRNRTISSTCGLSIEFKKGQMHLVPPAMYDEVIAAGGVPESELEEDELPPKPITPEAQAEREKKLFEVYAKIAKRNARNDFSAGGQPHLSVLQRELGWEVTTKERDSTWVKFLGKTHTDD